MIRCVYAPTRVQRQQYLATLLNDYPSEQWDRIELDALSVTIQDLCQEAMTYTLTGKQRLLLVSNAYFFTTQRKPAIDQLQDFDVFERLFSQTLDLPHIVFLLEEPWDGKNKWIKLLKQTQDVIELPLLKKQAWFPFLDEALNMRSLSWSYAMKSLFIERLYPDLDRAIQELDKLALYGEPLTEVQLKAWIPITLESNVFELSNALLEGKMADAMRMYQDLIVQRVEPVTLLSLFARQLVLMRRVYGLLDQGMQGSAIASALNVHEYRIKLMAQYKKTIPSSRLETAILSLAELDYQIKTGQIDRVHGMELWLLNF